MKDKITCRTCKPHKKIARDQAVTHIKKIHKIVKPDGSVLRGWKTEDDGKNYTPVFRQPHEEDSLDVGQDSLIETDDDEREDELEEINQIKKNDSLKNISHEKSPDKKGRNIHQGIPLSDRDNPKQDIEEPASFKQTDIMELSSCKVTGEYGNYDQINVDEGTDYSSSDTEEYTVKRRKIKYERIEKRNDECMKKCFSEQEGNRDVIQEMKEWMLSTSTTVSSTGNKEVSTIRKTIWNLFKDSDSMLAYETSKCPAFSLSDFFLFHPNDKQKLRKITDPRPWVNRISGFQNFGKR